MSDCCPQSCTTSYINNKHPCPVNGKEYKTVSEKTVIHHIKEPWHWKSKNQRYYFCDDPECDVVYFGKDNTIIEKSAVRTSVGVKEKLKDALICYCFGVTANEALIYPEVKKFVIEKTKVGSCECEARNPSGKCCLKDFP